MFNEIDVNIEKIFSDAIFCGNGEQIDQLLKNSNNLKFVLLNYKREKLFKIKDYYDFLISNKDQKIDFYFNF